MRRTIRATVAVCAALVLTAGGSGSGPAGAAAATIGPPSGTTATGLATTATTAAAIAARRTRTAHAAAQLARFFRVVVAADARVRAVARRINQDIGTDVIDPSEGAARAVIRLDVTDVARAIPAGTPATLQRRALGLYANLSSRRSCFVRFVEYADDGPIRRTSAKGRDILGCLKNGSTPAANFSTNLAAARLLAARTPAFAVRAPSSRAAAEIAARAAYVNGRNGGCGSCGGWAPRPGPSLRVRWDNAAATGRVGPTSTFDEDGIAFTARYRKGAGWLIELNAC